MVASQNGWPGITSGSDARLAPLSWITGRVLAGAAWVIFDYLCRRFAAEVEPITRAWSWGHAYRVVRAGVSLSNHASGTAIDLNAPIHTHGARGTFAPAQVAAIRRILASLGGVVRWGGDYAGRADEMHFEIVGTAAQVAAVAARISSGTVSNPVANVPTAPATTPAAQTPSAPALAHEEDPDMRDTVRYAYRRFLGREPAESEYDVHLGALVQGQATLLSIRQSIARSAEAWSAEARARRVAINPAWRDLHVPEV